MSSNDIQRGAGSEPKIVETDVVVIGGGGAGLAAAIEARSIGRDVVLLEKNEKLGGSTSWSVGSVTATNTPHQIREGIKDCPEHHFEDMGRFGARTGLADNEVLRRLLVENASETFRWLCSLGVEFVGPLPEPPHRKPRMHNVLPNSRAFAYHLGKRARRIGVDIRYGIRAREIVRDNGRAVGVRCETPAGPTVFRARGGIVLATGDFSGNAAMRVELISKDLADLEPINATNTGDGHQMVLALGGRLIHPQFHLAGIRFRAPPAKWITRLPPYQALTRTMNWAMRHLPDGVLRPFIMSFLTTILLPSPDLYRHGAILLNKRGERFSREGAEAQLAITQQPDKCAYILLDARLVKLFSAWPNYVSTAPGVAYAYIQDYARNRKDIYYSAPSIGMLAAQLDMPAANVERSIESFNESVDRGTEGRRPKLGTGPYVALGPVGSYVNFTDSGVAVDRALRVLGANDVPIPGLYAAGFIGMGGVLLEGHGHHLAWAFTSGRIAGRHAAFRALSADLPPSEGHSYRVEAETESPPKSPSALVA